MANVKKTMAQGFGNGELWPVLQDLVTDLNALKDLANDLKAKYNAAVTLINELKTDHNALLAKLDLDAGVTDTNYAALHTTSAADAAVTAVANVTPLTTT